MNKVIVHRSDGWRNERIEGFETPADLFAREPGEADIMIYSPDGVNELFASLLGQLHSPAAMWIKLLADDEQAQKLAAQLNTLRTEMKLRGLNFEFSILWVVKDEENAAPPTNSDP